MPLILSVAIFRKRWLRPYLIMMATMLIDIDHLLASPVYDPNRCSIGFHPLHHPLVIIVYGVMLGFPKTRLIGMGLLIHMALDGVDCFI